MDGRKKPCFLPSMAGRFFPKRFLGSRRIFIFSKHGKNWFNSSDERRLSMEHSVHSWCRWISLFLLPWLLLALVGCGGQPTQQANPAEAKYAEMEKALADLKYEKAISLTSEVLSKFGDTEFADKARILRTVLLAGACDGYRDLAETYMKGMEKAKRGGPLRATAYDYYRKEKGSALGFFESASYCLKNFVDTKKCVLDCKFPSQDIVNNRFLDLVLRGSEIEQDKRMQAEEDELRNGFIRMLTRFVGAGEDRMKARKLLEGGAFEVDHTVFFLTMSQQLLKSQMLFARSVLNEPDKYQAFFQKAVDSYNQVDRLLKAKPDKDLQKGANKVKADIDALKKKGLKAT
jgi:hypothetical protein